MIQAARVGSVAADGTGITRHVTFISFLAGRENAISLPCFKTYMSADALYCNASYFAHTL